MKIIFSLNHFLPHRLAGIEVYTFNLAKALQQSGMEVKVLVPFFDSDENDQFEYEGIQVIRYAENSEHSRSVVMGNKAPGGLVSFIQIIQQEKPDIWHAQELSSGLGIGKYHLEAVKTMGIPVVLTMHLSTYSCETGNLVYKGQSLCDGMIRENRCTTCVYQARGVNGVQAKVLNSAAAILYKAGINTSALNNSLGTALAYPFLIRKKRNDLLKLAEQCSRIVVLTTFYQKILKENGVPTNKLMLCEQGLTGKPVATHAAQIVLPIKLVFVGRVSKYKGIHLLLEALKSIPADKMSLDIYGPVTEDAYWIECSHLSAGMKNVQWKGAIAPGEVIGMLAGYDLLCLPSTFSEMSPLVIQEAFAAGIPVFASNVYGNAEQVQEGLNGWLFEFKNVTSLKEKLERLIAQPGLIDEARKNIPATKSFDSIAMEHLVMYKEVMGLIS